MSRAENSRRYAKTWRDRNPEKVVAGRKAARAKDPEKHRARSKAWRDANKESVRAHSSAYRAKKQASGGAHSADDVAWLIEQQKGRCALCGKRLVGAYHVDHVMPLSKGGTDDRGNLQIVHPVCNLRKAAKLPHVHAKECGRLL